MIALDVHPINNLRVLFDLRDEFQASEGQQAQWYRHWAVTCFDALEPMLANHRQTGRFCHGDAPGLADLCLAGQVINNRRFDAPPAPIPAIAKAAPEFQPDAAD